VGHGREGGGPCGRYYPMIGSQPSGPSRNPAERRRGRPVYRVTSPRGRGVEGRTVAQREPWVRRRQRAAGKSGFNGEPLYGLLGSLGTVHDLGVCGTASRP
jgi:hypothetical protein